MGKSGWRRHPHDTDIFTYDEDEEPVAFVDASGFLRKQQHPKRQYRQATDFSEI